MQAKVRGYGSIKLDQVMKKEGKNVLSTTPWFIPNQWMFLVLLDSKSDKDDSKTTWFNLTYLGWVFKVFVRVCLGHPYL